jgi:predicted nucleic acid-binding OB-fold protein
MAARFDSHKELDSFLWNIMVGVQPLPDRVIIADDKYSLLYDYMAYDRRLSSPEEFHSKALMYTVGNHSIRIYSNYQWELEKGINEATTKRKEQESSS